VLGGRGQLERLVKGRAGEHGVRRCGLAAQARQQHVEFGVLVVAPLAERLGFRHAEGHLDHADSP
jgi:hypothetical protein